MTAWRAEAPYRTVSACKIEMRAPEYWCHSTLFASLSSHNTQNPSTSFSRRNNSMRRSFVVVGVYCTLAQIAPIASFGGIASFRVPKAKHNHPSFTVSHDAAIHRRLALPMTPHSVLEIAGLPTQIYDTVSSTLSFSSAIPISSDPESWKFKVLSDISHLTLDLFAYLTPEKIFLRLASVVGRLSSISAMGYVSENAPPPEELIFQACMLGASIALLFKSAVPLIITSLYGSTESFRDRVAYLSLFRPVGLSWLQYRSLLATSGDWVTAPPNSTIVSDATHHLFYRHDSGVASSGDETFLYWLYKGDAQISFQNSTIQYMERRHGKCVNSLQDDIGLLADMQFSHQLEEREKKRNKVKTTAKPKPTGQGQNFEVEIKIGPKGATLLRLNTQKLIKLMDDDGKLDSSIQSLLLNGMHRNFSTLLSNKKNSDRQHQERIMYEEMKTAQLKE